MSTIAKRRAGPAARRESRRRSLLIAAALLLLILAVAVALLIYARGATASHELVGGAVVTDPQPAPDFTLGDQFGAAQTLSGYKSKPVALTFIYTNCPDVCPLISAHLHQTYQALGSQAAGVAIVAVTVDPERDDQARLRAFSDQIGLTQEWHFLTGSRPQLAAVWDAYGIDATKAHATASAQGKTQDPSAEADLIEHSAPVFLIDKRGLVRAMLPVDVSAEDITRDLQVLLAEKG